MGARGREDHIDTLCTITTTLPGRTSAQSPPRGVTGDAATRPARENHDVLDTFSGSWRQFLLTQIMADRDSLQHWQSQWHPS
jgi:hypothetical protein